uniref:Uncharacterized protein n=1 Tax=Rhodnius prolixus TaxID=13249 RepID=T1H7V9_RHOPR
MSRDFGNCLKPYWTAQPSLVLLVFNWLQSCGGVGAQLLRVNSALSKVKRTPI